MKMWKVILFVCLYLAGVPPYEMRGCEREEEPNSEVYEVIRGCGRKRKLNSQGYVGYILSHPDIFINNYLNNMNCTWFLTGRPNTIVRLKIHFFELQSSDNCRRDSLTLYDGPDVYQPVLETLCGWGPYKYFDSSGRSLTLRFRTDGAGNGRGFEVLYKFLDRKMRGCGDIRSFDDKNSGSVDCPPSYRPHVYNSSNNLDCTWSITAGPGQIICAAITHFYTERSPDCMRESLSIYDGPDVSSPMVKKMCGRKPNSTQLLFETLYSSGQSLTFRCKADVSITRWGFGFDFNFYDAETGAPIRGMSKAACEFYKNLRSLRVTMRKWMKQSVDEATLPIDFNSSSNTTPMPLEASSSEQSTSVASAAVGITEEYQGKKFAEQRYESPITEVPLVDEATLPDDFNSPSTPKP